MHELSIARAMIRQVQDEARSRGARRVGRVAVRIGELSGVERALLEVAFTEASRGTLAEGAALEVDYVVAAWVCPACDRAYDGGRLRCAGCGRPLTLAGGDELLLTRLDLELEDV